ncbi:unnamed protein product [Sphagnum tenellum]
MEDCHAESNETQFLSLMDSMIATPLARDEVAPWFSLIVEVLFVVLVSSQRKHLKTFGDLDMGLKKTARAFKAIEAAIKWGLKKVEAGAQGEHKKGSLIMMLISFVPCDAFADKDGIEIAE